MVSFEDIRDRKKSVAVVGLGYVGLPLAVAFSHLYDVIGFDINAARIQELESGADHTNEVAPAKLATARINFTTDPVALARAGIIIVAVPTPIDSHRNPDLVPVIGSSRTVGRHMNRGCIVVYESTVYPGLTEELCVPVLEEESGLIFNKDFEVGYSPERINPGDKVHTLETIVKIVSGSSPHAADVLAKLYGSVVKAGIHRASSIKVAEAAKVIENTQRDLNIALMNELAMIFGHMGLDTREVLAAAGSKWNFLPFQPGLVGGHCIGVDPYYLTYKAEELGFHPEVILAGRRINDRMGKYLAECTIKRLIRAGSKVNGCRIGILGFTFKENVPDLRNTRVIDVVRELEDYGAEVIITDAMASPDAAREQYNISLQSIDSLTDLDALILAVGHREYAALAPEKIKSFFANPDVAIVLDAKGFFDQEAMRANGIDFWRL